MRELALKTWCEQQLGGKVELQGLSGDASFRRYFRVVKDAKTWMAADAPPATEKNTEFVYIANLLYKHKVCAPQIVASDVTSGFLLLSDLGDQTLLPLLNENTINDYYTKAISLLLDMQVMTGYDLPDYSQAKLNEEMALFSEWFVGQLLGYTMSFEEQALIERVFAKLSQSALEQPQCFVHRDYHSRNLMVVDQQLAVIDFQDALRGAVTYDLVSILRDCYIKWPASDVEAWLILYYEKAKQSGVIADDMTLDIFKQWFDWMGLQRHIKVLGIFARLSLRDEKHGYLLDLPLVIEYVLEVLAKYPQDEDLSAFLRWFGEVLMPLTENKPWIVGRQ